jgi:hypothetical protein
LFEGVLGMVVELLALIVGELVLKVGKFGFVEVLLLGLVVDGLLQLLNLGSVGCDFKQAVLPGCFSVFLFELVLFGDFFYCFTFLFYCYSIVLPDIVGLDVVGFSFSNPVQELLFEIGYFVLMDGLEIEWDVLHLLRVLLFF